MVCHFDDKWLLAQDSKGYFVYEWGKKHSDTELYCNVCASVIDIRKGFDRIRQHFKGQRHINLCSQVLHCKNLISIQPEASNNSPSTSNIVKIYDINEAAHKAELLWALKTVSANYSANSSNGIPNLFRAMFPTPGAVPKNFSVSATKLSYLITDALEPYFRDEMLSEVQCVNYSLQYDETTNAAGQKELQIRVKFWSEKCNMVISHHLETFFIGYATSEIILENIIKALQNANMPLLKLISIGSDGPNVNKRVFNLLNEEVLKIRKKGLLDVGTCNIHTVHNTFRKGLEELGEDASDLVTSLYYFFDDWPARWEDYTDIQKQHKVPGKRFQKHVSSRWLTLQNAVQNVLDQWPAVLQYFLKYIPLHKSNLMNGSSYKKITDLLKKKTMKCELLFIVSSAGLFIKFTRKFQTQEPLIHELYIELKDLFLTIVRRVCKNTKVSHVEIDDKIFEKSNLLPVRDMVFDDVLKKELLNLTESERKLFITHTQKHYIAAGTYLLKKNILENRPLKYARCLKLSTRTKPATVKDVVNLAYYLPLDIHLDELADEWKSMQLLADPENPNTRIETFWNHYISMRLETGELKFPILAQLIKATLSVNHGSADVERGFSLSHQFLSEDRTMMKNRMLNACPTVYDALQRYEGKPENVPLTPKLLKLASTACKNYQAYLDSEKQRKEREIKEVLILEEQLRKEKEMREKVDKESKEVKNLNEKFLDAKKEAKMQSEITENLLSKANDSLKRALQKNDIKEARISQTMIDAAVTGKKNLKEKEKEVDGLVKKIEKRKDAIIDNFLVPKKPKKD